MSCVICHRKIKKQGRRQASDNGQSRQGLIRRFVKLTYPYVIKNKSVPDIEAAVSGRMPTLPEEIKTASLITMRTVINLQRAWRFKGSQENRQLPSVVKDGRIDGETATTEELKEAEDIATDTSKIPSQGRQILATLPVLLADDPEFEEIYSSAFDQEPPRSIHLSTTPPRRVVAAETTGSETPPYQRRGNQETAAAAKKEEKRDFEEINKPMYRGQFVCKKSSGRSPVVQRSSTLQPPAGAPKPVLQRRPAFPPPPIEMSSSSALSRIPDRRPTPAIPLDRPDQPHYQRHHHVGPRRRHSGHTGNHPTPEMQRWGRDPRLVTSNSPHRGHQQQSTPSLRRVDNRGQDSSRRTPMNQGHRPQGREAQQRSEDPRDDRRRRSPQRSRSPLHDRQQRFRSANADFQDQLREFLADMLTSRRQR